LLNNMKKNSLYIVIFALIIALSEEVMAHCPLCVAGAMAAAGGAAYLGVSNIVIGLFIGAFAVSIGFWVSRLIKKKYVPLQTTLLVLLSYFLTILPLISRMEGFYPFYISLFGDYGSLFNRTYLLNLFLIGSIIGGVIVLITPWMSNRITKLRGKIMPYQGTVLTLSLLIIIGVIMELV